MSPVRRRFSWIAILLRALRSTLLICLIALVGAAIRSGRLKLSDLQLLLDRYWMVSIGVFAFVLIWDLWFLNTQRSRSHQDDRP